jgi:flagellar basal-body rod modification protein FlgD
MPINMINPLTTVSTNSSSEVSQMTDPDMFLKLLMASIQNQDPFNSDNDPTAQMSQLAEFASLESMNKLNSNIEMLFQVNNTTQAMSLIGKSTTVTFVDAETEQIVQEKGIVDSVQFKDGETYINMNGNLYPMSVISEVAANE